jgi:hypothetical protein
MGTGSSIKDILTIMCDEQVLASAAGRPVVDGSILKTGTYNLARNSSDLEALNLLHGDLIIPCHRRKHQSSGFVATFALMIIQRYWRRSNHLIR